MAMVMSTSRSVNPCPFARLSAPGRFSTTETTERRSRNRAFLPQRAQRTQRESLRDDKNLGIGGTE